MRGGDRPWFAPYSVTVLLVLWIACTIPEGRRPDGLLGKKRLRSYHKRRKSTRRKVAQRRAGMLPTRKGLTWNLTTSPYTIPETEFDRRLRDLPEPEPDFPPTGREILRKKKREQKKREKGITSPPTPQPTLAFMADDVGEEEEEDPSKYPKWLREILHLEEGLQAAKREERKASGEADPNEGKPLTAADRKRRAKVLKRITGETDDTSSGEWIPDQLAEDIANENDRLREVRGKGYLGPKDAAPPIEMLQWNKSQLIKVAAAARQYQLELGLPDHRHIKRIPGHVSREDLWMAIPGPLRTLLENAELEERVLGRPNLVETLAMSRDLIHPYLWRQPDTGWEQRVEQAFDAFRSNRTHISIYKAQVALGSEMLRCAVPWPTFTKMTKPLIDDARNTTHALRGRPPPFPLISTSIRKFQEAQEKGGGLRKISASDPESGHVSLRPETPGGLRKFVEILEVSEELERVSVPGFALDFRAFRVLAGIVREGLLDPPSPEEVKLLRQRKLEVKRAAEETQERLRKKYLPKCDWSSQRMADYKRHKKRLEDFFLDTGMGRSALLRINERRKGKEPKLSTVLQAMTELARYTNLTHGYHRVFGKYFNRGHRPREPHFKEALFQELGWFVAKGHVQPRKNDSEFWQGLMKGGSGEGAVASIMHKVFDDEGGSREEEGGADKQLQQKPSTIIRKLAGKTPLAEARSMSTPSGLIEMTQGLRIQQQAKRVKLMDEVDSAFK